MIPTTIPNVANDPMLFTSHPKFMPKKPDRNVRGRNRLAMTVSWPRVQFCWVYVDDR